MWADLTARACVALALMGLAACATCEQPGGLGVNVLVNGGAEGTGACRSDPDRAVGIPCWTGRAVNLCYAALANAPNASSFLGPPSASRGIALFAGGANNARDRLEQQVTVPAGAQGFSFSAYMFGFALDNVAARVTFKRKRAVIRSYRLAYSAPKELPDGKSSLLYTAVSASLPTGATSAEVTLVFQGSNETAYLAGYADNLTLIFRGH